MRIIDVDSHFAEPNDWLAHAAPALAAELPPPQPLVDSVAAMLAPSQDDTAPKERRPPRELLEPGFRVSLEENEALFSDHYDAASGDPFYCETERLALLDAAGIDIQWVNPGALPASLMLATISGRGDLSHPIIEAWHGFAADHVAGSKGRLQPVAQIDINDLEWSIAEMTHMRGVGSRAFQLQHHPEKSLTHPDFEPLWSAAEDLGMAGYIHVFFGPPSFGGVWRNNGRDRSVGPVLPSERRVETRRFLTAMAIDGVFEAHPNLRFVLAETGYSWLPPYMREVDHKACERDVSGHVREHLAWHLPLLPSEYIQRHVRVATTYGFQSAGVEGLPLAEALGALAYPDMIVFSTDWPHIEGGGNAIADLGRLLPDDPRIHERFYGDSMDDFMVAL